MPGENPLMDRPAYEAFTSSLTSALALLDLAQRELEPFLPAWPSAAAEAVGKRLREAREGRAAG